MRPAGEADTEFLYVLYASTRADEMALVDWREQQKVEFLHMQFNAQHRFYHEQFGTARFDIIESNNAPIGRLYVDRRADEIRIIDIALLPEYRARGIGKELMQSLMEEASVGKQSVTIHVEHNNPAMHLYQRLGFKHIRDEGVYFFMKWDSGNSTKDVDQTRTDQENTAS